MVALTLHNYQKELSDQIFLDTRLWAVLMKKGIKASKDGGSTIRVPTEFATNTNVKAMGEYDDYSIDPQETFTAAEFNWLSPFVGTVPITHKARVINSGKHAIIDYAKEAVNNLKKSLQRQANQQLFSDGTVANEVAGLRAIVLATGTYGGIPRAGNTWWQGGVDSTTEALSVDDMKKAFNTAGHNMSSPDCIPTTQTLYEKYEGMAQSFQQITQTQNGDLGFMHLQFKGVPLFWDIHCPSGEMYFLTSK